MQQTVEFAHLNRERFKRHLINHARLLNFIG